VVAMTQARVGLPWTLWLNLSLCWLPTSRQPRSWKFAKAAWMARSWDDTTTF